MKATRSLSHHSSVSRSNPAPLSFDYYCEDCGAFVALNVHVRCDICNSSAVSISPSPSRVEALLQEQASEVRVHRSQMTPLLRRLVAVVRQSRGAA
jgi:hypothetical protein